MTERLTDEWRACQQLVYELERRCGAAMLAYLRGEGLESPAEMRRELEAMRKDADRLFSGALADIDLRDESDCKLRGR